MRHERSISLTDCCRRWWQFGTC
uniref:Uncharacterized protein n=1 Tax=Anguilla anguilla TaxID=7936 RepID=A0A0E9QEE8_ANGAN